MYKARFQMLEFQLIHLFTVCVMMTMMMMTTRLLTYTNKCIRFTTSSYLLLLRNLSSCNTAIALVHRIAVWMRVYRVNAMLAKDVLSPPSLLSSSSTTRRITAVKQRRTSCKWRKLQFIVVVQCLTATLLQSDRVQLTASLSPSFC